MLPLATHEPDEVLPAPEVDDTASKLPQAGTDTDTDTATDTDTDTDTDEQQPSRVGEAIIIARTSPPVSYYLAAMQSLLDSMLEQQAELTSMRQDLSSLQRTRVCPNARRVREVSEQVLKVAFGNTGLDHVEKNTWQLSTDPGVSEPATVLGSEKHTMQAALDESMMRCNLDGRPGSLSGLDREVAELLAMISPALLLECPHGQECGTLDAHQGINRSFPERFVSGCK